MSETLQLNVVENSSSAINALNGLISMLKKVQTAVENGLSFTKVANGIAKITKALSTEIPENNVAKFERIAAAVEKFSASGTVKITGIEKTLQNTGISDIQDVADSGIRQLQEEFQTVEQSGTEAFQSIQQSATAAASQYADNMSKAELLRMKLDALKAELETGISEQTFDTKRIANYGLQIQQIQAQIEKLDKDASSAAKGGLKELVDKLHEAGKISNKSGGFIKKLVSSFGRIAFYRAIRSAIKAITDGFKEGVTNVRAYSEAIGSDFARDMASASATMTTFKNSLGAAVAPVLQMLIPILNSVASAAIVAVNALNQLFALLRGGGSWTRAKTVSESLDGIKKSAGGAGGALKGLLAAWDELNIIQSKGGGGGGGGGADALGYEDMFEEVYVFDEKMRQIADFLRENADTIFGIVKKIGVAILAWNVSQAFGGIIAALGSMAAAGLTVAIVFDMVTLFDKQYLKTGEIGWLIGDVLTTALGAGIASQVVENVAGHGAGVAVASIVLAFSAAASIMAYIGATDVDALSQEGITTAVLGALKFGAGIFLLDKGLLGASTGTAIAEGLYGAAIVLGASVGVKAVLQAVDSGITDSTWKSVALSSVAMGLGTFGLARSLSAAGIIHLSGLVAALGIGAAGAIATGLVLAAAVGVVAYLQSQESDIHWGNLNATTEQIQNFVKTEMFSADVSANINIANSVVTASDVEKKNIQDQVAGIMPQINKLKLGVDEAESLANIQKQVFGDSESGEGGLIGNFKTLAAKQKTLVETGITLVPLKNNEGQDVSGDFISQSFEGWDLLEEYMESLGRELNAHLSKGMDESLSEELRKYEKNAVVEIAETMARISRAAATGESSARAELDFELNLKNLTKGSFEEAITFYNDYAKEVENAFIQSTKEVAASYKGQAAAFAEIAASATDPETKKLYEDKASEYYALYEEYYDKALHGVEEATANAKEKGQEILREWIENTAGDAIKNAKVPITTLGIFGDSMLRGLDTKEAFRALVSAATQIPESVFKALDTTGWEFLSDELKQKLYETISDAYGEDETKQLFSKAGLELPNQIKNIIDESIQEAADAVENQEPQQVVIPLEAHAVIEQADETMDFGYVYDADSAGSVNVVLPIDLTGNADDSSIQGLYDSLYRDLMDYSPETSALDTNEFFDYLFDEYIQSIGKAGGLAEDEINAIADQFYDSWIQKLFDEDFDPTMNEMLDALRQSFESSDGWSLGPIDTSGFDDSITQSADNTVTQVNRMISALNALNGITIRGGIGGNSFRLGALSSRPMYTFAEGGYPTVGDMFIAREAGPEMVGRIGNRTAVANNDQIVTGVASGVAAGQAEQNALLRQQNDYLRRILAKESTVKVEPSASWGRFNKRSEEMRLKGAGA